MCKLTRSTSQAQQLLTLWCAALEKKVKHSLSENLLVMKLQQTQRNEKLKRSRESVRSRNTELMFQKKNACLEVQKTPKLTVEEMVGCFQYALNGIRQTCIALSERG